MCNVISPEPVAELTSYARDYFITTGVLYTLSWLYGQIRTYFEFGVSRKATFEMVSDACMKITVPINSQWQPAQHVFLRFIALNIHSMTAHPFTICSVPNPSGETGQTKMVFYVYPRGGLTGRLASLATQQPGYTVPVLIDGPYGGVKGQPLHQYDRSLVITCGSGAALSLGLTMDIILRCAHRKQGAADTTGSRVHHMQIIMASRDPRLVEWYEEALLSFMAETGTTWPAEELSVSVYQTGPGSKKSGSSNDVENQYIEQKTADSVKKCQLPITTHVGRPNIAAIVRQATLQREISLGIAVCGPPGVITEVQDESAAAQLRVLGGSAGAREVYLHSELFSW